MKRGLWIIKTFISYTKDSLKTYFRGLFPQTRIIHFTNPRCHKVINISKEWMGKEVQENVSYELKEIDPKRILLEKENLPLIQKVIQDYEEENGEVIVDKTVMSRT